MKFTQYKISSRKPLFIVLLLLSIFTISCGKTGTSATESSQSLTINNNKTLSTVRDYFNRAEDKVEQGDLSGAVLDYTQAINLKPKFIQAYNSRGLAHRKARNYQKAIADYNQAIKINPKYAEALNNRGLAHYYLKDYQSAIADFNQALKINPRLATAYSNRGLVYRNLKDYQKAINDYDQAIKLDPKYDTAYNNRGNAY
ncbi:MAG: tetratricopeptide repeat protein, partial [Cyanobacteria bacterium J06641_2]